MEVNSYYVVNLNSVSIQKAQGCSGSTRGMCIVGKQQSSKIELKIQ